MRRLRRRFDGSKSFPTPGARYRNSPVFHTAKLLSGRIDSSIEWLEEQSGWWQFGTVHSYRRGRVSDRWTCRLPRVAERGDQGPVVADCADQNRFQRNLGLGFGVRSDGTRPVKTSSICWEFAKQRSARAGNQGAFPPRLLQSPGNTWQNRASPSGSPMIGWHLVGLPPFGRPRSASDSLHRITLTHTV